MREFELGQPHEYDLKTQTVGIIGYGRFGRLIHDRLLPRNGIPALVYDPQASRDSDVRSVDNLEDLVRNSSVVIPAVPINQFRHVLELIGPNLRKGSLVMDVCSVKEYPAATMLELLPDSANVISTHPMFGEKTVESQDGKLEGLKFVMWNTRCKPEIYDATRNHFDSLGLDIIEMSPTEHDDLASKSQFFAQSIRYIAEKLHLQPTDIDTLAARSIFQALNLMGGDNQIFTDLITYNRFCRKMISDMADTLNDLKEKGSANTIFTSDLSLKKHPRDSSSQ